MIQLAPESQPIHISYPKIGIELNQLLQNQLPFVLVCVCVCVVFAHQLDSDCFGQFQNIFTRVSLFTVPQRDGQYAEGHTHDPHQTLRRRHHVHFHGRRRHVQR